MICKVSWSVLLLGSAAMAQNVIPGTLASSATPESGLDGVSSSLGGASSYFTGTSSSFTGTSSSSSDGREPVTAQQRIQWVIKSTIGSGALFSAAFGTLVDNPKAYGTHWEGFGERYGIRLTGLAVSNTMEAGLGVIWGEDPRYTRDAGAPFKNRIGHAIKMTYMAQNRDGSLMPAYARFIAIPGSNFLSNTWRTDSDATVDHAAIRTGFRFLGRLGTNTFQEFWPDVRQRLLTRWHSASVQPGN
jgi:hypothetical protein